MPKISNKKRRARLSDCFTYANLSKCEVLRLTLRRLDYADEQIEGISPELLRNLRKLYETGKVGEDAVREELTTLLDGLNRDNRIVPLSPNPSGLTCDEEDTSIRIIDAPFLVSLNMLLRASKYAFMPYRKPNISKDAVRKTLYTRDIMLIEEVKNELDLRKD